MTYCSDILRTILNPLCQLTLLEFFSSPPFIILGGICFIYLKSSWFFIGAIQHRGFVLIFFFYFFWQVVRFRDSVVHKICRFIGMNFLTNTSLSLSVHLQSRGGKDEDGDQAMGICFSPENHLEIYLFLNLYIIQLSLMGIQMLIRALFSR